MPSNPACARCSGASIPIVYGLPGFELFETADRGEVALGGCVFDDEAAEWRCRGCELEFA